MSLLNGVKRNNLLIFLTILLSISFSSTFNIANDTISPEKSENAVYDEDSFMVVDDEFSEFNEFSEIEEVDKKACDSCPYGKDKDRKTALYWVLGSLFFTILAGVFVRFKSTRSLRGLFLIAAVIFLGFYHGACPCPIMSLQNTVLLSIGAAIHWQQVIWFLALIPITYFFGRVWCGWICHLGALQEFIFIPGRIKILQSLKAQKIMRIIRIILIVILIVQLVVTRTNYFVKIDPFKVAFNLFSSNLTGYILVALILLSSFFIYRPFCKMACPLGLVLGWISKIPGASVIEMDREYRSQGLCSSTCKIRAITKHQKETMIDSQECIACGDCLDACPNTRVSNPKKNKGTPSPNSSPKTLSSQKF